MKKNKYNLKHIYKDQLSGDVQDALDNQGFTIYKNVLVVWDKAKDDSVLQIVDYLSKKYPDKLLVAHLDGNVLELVWKDDTPKGFKNNIISTKKGYKTVLNSAILIPVYY